jgi:hypothetical protein
MSIRKPACFHPSGEEFLNQNGNAYVKASIAEASSSER